MTIQRRWVADLGGWKGRIVCGLVPSQVYEVDWSPPFRRVYMIPELEKQLGVKFPPPSEFHSSGRATQTT